MTRGSLGETQKVQAPIGIRMEARGAIVAALNYVQRNAGKL
jgi:hypothetical protein